jgi:hypothetical protein
MEDTDFDSLCDGVPPNEAKRLRKMLNEWCDGNEDSFPAQLALLTRAQWRAAAQTPVILKESLELLQMRLAEYGRQTATLLKSFNSAADTKTKALEEVIADHREVADVILADLRSHTTTAKSLLSKIESELTKGTAELERFRNQFIDERHRLEESRVRCEQQKHWSDGIVFGLLLLAMVVIGILIGWRWN